MLLRRTKRPPRDSLLIMGLLLLVLTLAPLARPFAPFVGAGNARSSTNHPSLPSTLRKFQPPSVSNNHRHRDAPASARSAATSLVGGGYPSLGNVALVAKDDPSWKSGESRASWISRFLFSYAAPLLSVATQRSLEASDSFHLPEKSQMYPSVESLTTIYHRLQNQSKRQIESIKYSDPEQLIPAQSMLLIQALLLHQRKALVWTGLLRFVNTAIQAFPALLVSRLLRLIEAGDAHHPRRALGTAVALVAVLSLKMVTENQLFHQVVKCSTNVRGSLSGLIFDKSLKLPGGGSSVTHEESGVQGALGTGGVLNLMQSDTGIIESAAMQLHTLWDGPLQIAIYTSLLYRYLGSSIFWGIAVLLVTIPVNSVALRILNRLAKYENEAKDARTRRTAESIRNMKLLKLQGWEKRFEEDIRQHRDDELRRHAARGVIRALNTAFSNAVPALVLVVTLTAYVKTGEPLVASTIFTAISLFNQLRFPLFFYPMLIDSIANGKNAMRRVASFLSAEEITPYVSKFPPLEEGGSIELRHGNFLWSTVQTTSASSAVAPALIDAKLRVGPGEVVAVVGSVGSGKSALLKALLGELTPSPRTIVQQAVSATTLESDNAVEGHIADKPMVIVHGYVAYCSQEAWLPKGSIKDAVVFGREFDESRYLQAMYDAGLDKDIASGVLADDTDVGEGGSALSGGQRARVALARALYSGNDTKVYLLDDCLAALDASVGSLVFQRLTRRLRASKAAVLLVTNDPSIPRLCDRVVLMKKLGSSSSCSTIQDIGTSDELMTRGHDMRRSLPAPEMIDESISRAARVEHDLLVPGRLSGHSDSKSTPALTSVVQKTIRVVGGYEGLENCTESTCHAEPESQIAMECCPNYIADHVVPVSPERKDVDVIFPEIANDTSVTLSPRQEIGSSGSVQPVSEAAQKRKLSVMTSADELMATGAVPLQTYFAYLRSVRKPVLIAGMIGSYLMANGAQFFQQFTIAKWTEASHGMESAAAAALGAQYMGSLVKAACVVSVFLWLRSFLTMQVGLRASNFLHSRMLESVFAAPMSFFDATPSGQLLSRFGKEMETVDRGIPDSIASVLFCLLQIFMSVGALIGVVTPGMMIPLALVSLLYVRAMSLFRPAARDMKRAETRTRSPIFTHFGEALRGTETIRSVPNATRIWSRKHRTLTDENLAVYFSVKALDRWLSTRLETLGNLVVFAASVASVFLTRSGRLKAGSAGWALTQSLAITGLLTWAVRCLTDLETNMMSLQRVRELTDLDSEETGVSAQSKRPSMPKENSIPGEALRPLITSTSFNATLAPLDSSSLREDGWPWFGNVRFFNVSMRYNPTSPLILDGVTLQVPAGSTLGVVGRTGSGKSSLLLTLFRLVEIEEGGRIEIDGVDLRSVALETLRQSLAIIPQDPVLFAGTVAYNLDATGKASDDEMWRALEAASPSLAQQFLKSDGLRSQISEGGKNLSLGQRQLICLARALLRRSRILVLDEATSSVDSKTDHEVQETILREFVQKGVTVITVAHRLDTVLGYDKIAVLGDGRVMEFGPPSELLQIPNGELRRLVLADRQNKRRSAATSAALAPAA